MEQVAQSIYQAMRDDSAATVGLRALLGNTTTTPYNVYHAFLPAGIDFSSTTAQSYITYQLISSVADIEQHSKGGRIMVETWQITAYAHTRTKVDSIHRRIRHRLDALHNVTLPTSQAVLHQIRFESLGPHTWDDAYKVFFQEATYRSWGRDDDIA